MYERRIHAHTQLSHTQNKTLNTNLIIAHLVRKPMRPNYSENLSALTQEASLSGCSFDTAAVDDYQKAYQTALTGL